MLRGSPERLQFVKGGSNGLDVQFGFEGEVVDVLSERQAFHFEYGHDGCEQVVGLCPGSVGR